MYRFAINHQEHFTRFVAFAGWSDNHEFPFARTSIEIIKMICEHLMIGRDPATEQASSAMQFYPMFFAHENPLDEMFAVVIMHVNKTWREMRATAADFDKVMEVAKEQVNWIMKVGMFSETRNFGFLVALTQIENATAHKFLSFNFTLTASPDSPHR